MSKASTTDWKRLATMKDEDIDTSDIAELGDDFFRPAELRQPAKQAVTIRLESDVLEWFKEQGQGLPDTHQPAIERVHGNQAAEIPLRLRLLPDRLQVGDQVCMATAERGIATR
ncbi:BrnA antitoxin family protein [Undibacterium sp. Ji50W]|uniref:BrnA antitoxin family protein n=1 Tax=Undibacterium sp. Ji50W TaxID=3413041 RepID=UPI003BF065A1